MVDGCGNKGRALGELNIKKSQKVKITSSFLEAIFDFFDFSAVTTSNDVSRNSSVLFFH